MALVDDIRTERTGRFALLAAQNEKREAFRVWGEAVI